MLSEDNIVRAGAHLEDGYRAAMEFFGARAGDRRPTAISCYNDLVAIGVCRAMTELGLRVPDDVSVIGFDDIALGQYLAVPLTTIRVPTFRMGQIAAEMLVQHIESKAVIPAQKAFLDAELVVRASTRAIGDGVRAGVTAALASTGAAPLTSSH
jgi:LacI family transcriptional regulator/LacI family repressor for deo operon, udp, cdd, tsx, nupC, and nupG